MPCKTHIAHIARTRGTGRVRRVGTPYGFCMVFAWFLHDMWNSLFFLHGFARGFLHDITCGLFFCMTRGTACTFRTVLNCMLFNPVEVPPVFS